MIKVKDFGEKLDLLMTEYSHIAGSKTKLATLLHVTPAALSQWLRTDESQDGQVSSIPEHRLEKIAQLYQINMDYFSFEVERFKDLLKHNIYVHIASFKRDIGPHFSDRDRTGFVGRNWLFQQIDAFISTKPSGYYLIEGDPGIGKTSILLKLVTDKNIIHHFNMRHLGGNTYATFIKNICAQLIMRYDLRVETFKPEHVKDGHFLFQCLHQAIDAAKKEDSKSRLIIAIDALDELDEVLPTGNILYLPRTLPDGVYILLTSRRDRDRNLVADTLEKFHLNQDDSRQLEDIKAYIKHHIKDNLITDYIAEHLKSDTEQFIENLSRWSQGNFMYLRYVLCDLKNREKWAMYQKPEQGFPDGLEGYYKTHWNFIRHQRAYEWEQIHLPVILALTAYREALKKSFLVDLSNRISKEIYQKPGGITRAQLGTVLDLWTQFIYHRSIVDAQDTSEYRLYHNSFQEYVNQLSEIEDHKVELPATNRLIGDFYLDKLDIDKQLLDQDSDYEPEED